MDKNELLKMLDLGGKETTPQAATEVAITSTDARPRPPASPTALELDEWALRRGREVLKDSERLQQTGLDDNGILLPSRRRTNAARIPWMGRCPPCGRQGRAGSQQGSGRMPGSGYGVGDGTRLAWQQ